jgi:hypothetical protein
MFTPHAKYYYCNDHSLEIYEDLLEMLAGHWPFYISLFQLGLLILVLSVLAFG